MKKEYIGVLDSGVGGLSVLSELVKALPEKNYLYFGDTKNMPYGTKTPEEILNYTKQILNFFIEKGVKTVVFACNTTSAVAYDELEKIFKNELKIFPLIQTVAKSAVENLDDGDNLAILATKATINSRKYNQEIAKINPKINVYGFDCTGFVEIVENRLYEDKKSLELIKEKIEEVKQINAKRVVLGCTHYPYLVDIFRKNFDVDYFNPAKCLSQIVKNYFNNNNEKSIGKVEFFVSNNPSEFQKSAKTFFDVEKVELINL